VLIVLSAAGSDEFFMLFFANDLAKVFHTELGEGELRFDANLVDPDAALFFFHPA
jgi:hypothetical protein